MMKFLVFGILLIYFDVYGEENCEVCERTIDKFRQTLIDKDLKDVKMIEEKFKEFCKTTVDKEERLCYYLGGLENSATGILTELSKPLSWSMPANKVCLKLQKKDAQICELRYEKQIDLDAVDLKKLKVKDLKRILNSLNSECEGCLEKVDFVNKIESLRHKLNNEL